MRGIVHNSGRSPVRRLARSRVTRWVVAIFIGASSVGGYVHFVPQLTAGFPFACNIPAQQPVDEKSGEPAVEQSPELALPSAASLASSEEIVDVSEEGDTLRSLLSYGVTKEDSVAEMAEKMALVIAQTEIAKKKGKKFTKDTPLQPGKRYSLTVDGEGRLIKATLELGPADVYHAEANDRLVRAWKEDVVLDFKVESRVFRVRGRLGDTVAKSGEGDRLTSMIAQAFRYDIDFRFDSRDGDICRVLFERRYADDRPSGYGDLLCAVYEGQKTGIKTVIRFKGEYYHQDGKSVEKPFLRSPLKFLRVTSKFGMRFHPVKKVYRMHCGMDFGAPTGTPAHAIADGVVSFAGWNPNHYGNLVCLRHKDPDSKEVIETRYGHLSKINVRNGQKVKQSEVIGLVGATGMVTGPHLHFEFRVNGKPIDPSTRTREMVKTVRHVPPSLVPRFQELRDARLHDMEGLVAVGEIFPRMGRSASLR
ncbi:MAG: M23 family metallopeptidase [Thermodesulfobacteriota bacterium]